jgi:hypothetical protein
MLPQIHQRTLIVHGSKDIVVMPINAFQLAQHLPDLRRAFWPYKRAPVFYSCNPSAIDPATDFMQFQESTQIFSKWGSRRTRVKPV